MKIPETPPDTKKIIEQLNNDNPEMLISIIHDPYMYEDQADYLHWDRLRYRPLPPGISNHEIWWTIVKSVRNNRYRELPLIGMEGLPFKIITLDSHLELTHYFDQMASGNITFQPSGIHPQLKDYYAANSLIEESITSSQMEGATTTRDIAKKMLQEGRSPRDQSEWMIVNNYEAINHVKDIKDEKLTIELILEIHGILTKNTLDSENKVGVLRSADDDIHILVDNDRVVFTPPDASQVEKSLDQLCMFANGELAMGFIHPVVQAVILHFMLSYIHPFIDGNGRTARALFYWFMLKKGYWLAEYISISRILKRAPAQYGKSFLYTETDENDLTYFIDYQFSVLKRAIDDLREYVRRKMEQAVDLEHMLSRPDLVEKLNIRQRTLLQSAVNEPGAIYSIKQYQKMHNVVYQTARNDLLELADTFNLLIKVKEQKSFIFMVPSDIQKRL